MALADLGTKLTKAFQKLSNSTLLDDDAVNGFVSSVSMALLQSDVDVQIVKRLQNNIKAKYAEINHDKGHNKRKLLNSIVEQELVKLVAHPKPPYKMERGKKTHRIMLVGLQGAGKTTTVGKYAHYYKHKGWKVGVIAADTFRAGAYAQARSNTLKVGAHFFGKEDCKDPAVVVEMGLQAFESLKMDLIILDTAGRHKQESALFEEMDALNTAFQPDHTFFVMDASIGKAISVQAEAFSKRVNIGSIILTKMDGSSKAGGALTAIATTNSPVAWIGTGEHMHQLQPFNPAGFIRRLLGGCGDVQQIMESVDESKLKQLKTTIESGEINFGNMMNQMEKMSELGGLSVISQMLPAGMVKQKDTDAANQQMKQAMTIFDSMTNEEKQSTDKLFFKQPSRITRLAKGSGNSEETVRHLIRSFKQFEASQKHMKAMSVPDAKKPGKMHGRGMPDMKQLQQFQKMMDPKMMQQMMKMMGKR